MSLATHMPVSVCGRKSRRSTILLMATAMLPLFAVTAKASCDFNGTFYLTNCGSNIFAHATSETSSLTVTDETVEYIEIAPQAGTSPTTQTLIVTGNTIVYKPQL